MADVNCAEIMHLCTQTFQATGELRLESQLLNLFISQFLANFISLKLSFIE